MEGKKICGRKRHILVDTQGNLLKVVVHRANILDRDGAAFVLEDICDDFPRLEHIWADKGYNGELADDVYEQHQITLEVVGNPANQKGFVVVPRRWVVERTFAWLGKYRRLSKDYEHRVEYSETWVYIASIARMLQNISPNDQIERPYCRVKQAA